MASANKKQPKNIRTSPPKETPKQPGPFGIPMPRLWLIVCVLVVFIPCCYLGYTELDDTIFINDFREYNENILNFFTSFTRGVFNPVNDIYYRPFFLNSMLLNYQFSKDNVMGYHFVNILFHLVNVLLVFQLFKKLRIKEWQAFVLALLFAVHPVLTQAVAWIPGRNDTLLAMFAVSYLIFTIDYSDEGKPKHLLLAFFFLLCAYFTKETAVFIPPIAFIIIVVLLEKKWLDKRNLIQYGVWVAAFLIWYFIRASVHLKSSYLDASVITHEFPSKLPIITQYLGKIFLPFNLSVFPIQEDTVNYYGIIALVLLVLIIVPVREKNMRYILGGFGIFLLFLLPLLILPRSLNEQTFEHRLYLPFIGILIMLPQTLLFRNKFSDRQVFTGFAVLIVICALVNYNQQKYFKDPYSFWSKAAETSPHSAYAIMMLGARTTEKPLAYSYMRRAYALNPKEKYLNYYYGVMLHEQDSAFQSEKYFLEEKKISDYYECDFYLSDIAYRRKNYPASISYLTAYLKRNPTNSVANNNLMLLYMTTGQKEKAAVQKQKMRELGLPTPK